MARLKAYQMDDRNIRVNIVGEDRVPDQDKVIYLKADGTIKIYEARDKKSDG